MSSNSTDLAAEFAQALGESLCRFSQGHPETRAACKSPESAECKEREQLSANAETAKPRVARQSLQGIRVVFVEDAALCDRIMKALNVMRPEFVGFDCEWNSKANVCADCTAAFDRESSQVSLLQIAHSSIIVLIRMHCFAPSAVPHSLRAFLSDNKILKVGVGIYYDCKKLKRSHGLNVRGWIEINKEFRQSVGEKQQLALYDAANIQFNGFASLATLCEVVLRREMQFKSARFEKVWDATYDHAQTMYAAEDALVGFQIFEALRRVRHTELECAKGQLGALDASLLAQQIEALERNDESLSLMLQDPDVVSSADPKDVDRMWHMKREMASLQSDLCAAQRRLEKFQTEQLYIMRAVKKSTPSRRRGGTNNETGNLI